MRNRRRGFTLVEILVAMALTIFILAILSQAFVTGADTFRTLKSIGDLNASLRNAATLLRNDLSADHFEGKRRLSDPTFWTPQGSPHNGYFYLFQGPIVAGKDVNEGVDANSLAARRRVSHKMAFTVKAKGTRPADYFIAKDPGGLAASFPGPYQSGGGGTISSQWLEVCYFLEPVPSTADGTQLYGLYRQQRLVIGDNTKLNWDVASRIAATPANLAAYQPIVSCMPSPTVPNTLYFNSPADLTIPERRTAGKFTYNLVNHTLTSTFTRLTGANGQPSGDDLLLTDVISFDIKVLTSTADFIDLPVIKPYFDTWSLRHDEAYDYSAKVTNVLLVRPVPNTLRILALQITIRIWDPRTKLSRQITIVQDM